MAWAQAGKDIPCLGTTQADYFYGDIPCTRSLTAEEVEEAYEKNTGEVILETFRERNLNPVYLPGVICRNHGPFAWGRNPREATYHAAVLEECAKMASYTVAVDPKVGEIPKHVLEKHFMRKHGPHAYYGQGK